jgi:hypothetical protein
MKTFLKFVNQSLIGLVVIDAEVGRENYGLIPRNCNQEGAKII